MENLPRLQAGDALHMVQQLVVGTGNARPADAKRKIRDWTRATGYKEAVRRGLSEEEKVAAMMEAGIQVG